MSQHSTFVLFELTLTNITVKILPFITVAELDIISSVEMIQSDT